MKMKLQIKDKVYDINHLKISTHVLRKEFIDHPWVLKILTFIEFWFDHKENIIVHTSGTTGIAKHTSILKSEILESTRITQAYFKYRNGDTALLCLPVDFIAGKIMICRAIHSQLHLIAVKPTSNPLKNINSTIDFIAMTPFQLSTVLKENPGKVDFVKTILLGGGPVSSKLNSQIQKLKSTCYLGYGMTETITHVAIKRLNGINPELYFTALDGINFSIDKDSCLVISANHLKENISTNDILFCQL